MKRSQKVSFNSLRGHLALKSSALKPTINKLQSQHLIQDQMTSHYYNMATIKPAIDSKAPSSTKRSIIKQDQMRRSAIIKKIQLQQELADQGYSPQEEPVIRRSLSSSTRPKSSSYTPEYKHSPYTTNTMLRSSMKINMNQTMRPKSANNATFKVNNNTTKMNKTMPRPNAREVTYNGDYLNRHSDRFVETEGKPFVPRTKKRNAKSFLSQSRHYAPPVRRPKTQPAKPSDDEEDSHEMNLTTVTFERTQDHERWVEDQAQFVQTLTLNDEYERGYDHDDHTCSEGRKTPANKAFEKAMEKQPFRDYNDAETAGKTRQKIIDEEEDLKYLSFINQVTNDILSRGIYSNTVLMKTMERHMQSRLHDLDEGKMRSMLADLTASLGIVDTEAEATPVMRNATKATSSPLQKHVTMTMRNATKAASSPTQKHVTMTDPSNTTIRNTTSNKTIRNTTSSSKSTTTRQRSTPPPSSNASSICEEVSELRVASVRSVASMSPAPSSSSTIRRGKETDDPAEVLKSAPRSNGTDEYESVSALATVLQVKDDDDEGEDEVFTATSPTTQHSPTSVSDEKQEDKTELEYSDDFSDDDF